jgi:hypothetical protein
MKIDFAIDIQIVLLYISNLIKNDQN